MTDLSAAIAAAREVLADIDARGMSFIAAERTTLIDTMRNLIAALDAAQGEAMFLLHTGTIYGNERGDWDIEANSGKAVDAYCDANPGKTVGLYLAPQAPPAAVPAGYVLVPENPARLTPDREAEEREAADIEVIRFARRAAGLLHGFMLDTNAIGAREAGVNLARSIKEALKADAAALAALRAQGATILGAEVAE